MKYAFTHTLHILTSEFPMAFSFLPLSEWKKVTTKKISILFTADYSILRLRVAVIILAVMFISMSFTADVSFLRAYFSGAVKDLTVSMSFTADVSFLL